MTPDVSPAETLLADFSALLWRGNALGRTGKQGVPTGHARLDKELPEEGWPVSMLTELIGTQQGIAEIRLLLPSLAALTSEGREVVMVTPPALLFAPGLLQAGIDIRRLVIVQAHKAADRLWAVEQAFKSAAAGAVLCWLPQARSEHLRRLQLAAAAHDGPAFVLRTPASRGEASPAPLRLACKAVALDCLAVEIIKRRGPPLGGAIMLPVALPSALESGGATRRVASTEDWHAMDSVVPA